MHWYNQTTFNLSVKPLDIYIYKHHLPSPKPNHTTSTQPQLNPSNPMHRERKKAKQAEQAKLKSSNTKSAKISISTSQPLESSHITKATCTPRTFLISFKDIRHLSYIPPQNTPSFSYTCPESEVIDQYRRKM